MAHQQAGRSGAAAREDIDRGRAARHHCRSRHATGARRRRGHSCFRSARSDDRARNSRRTAATRRRAVLRPFSDTDGQPLDTGLALYSPNGSFTGEDVLELHGTTAARSSWTCCRASSALGARMAEAGVFAPAIPQRQLDLTRPKRSRNLSDSARSRHARSLALDAGRVLRRVRS